MYRLSSSIGSQFKPIALHHYDGNGDPINAPLQRYSYSNKHTISSINKILHTINKKYHILMIIGDKSRATISTLLNRGIINFDHFIMARAEPLNYYNSNCNPQMLSVYIDRDEVLNDYRESEDYSELTADYIYSFEDYDNIMSDSCPAHDQYLQEVYKRKILYHEIMKRRKHGYYR